MYAEIYMNMYESKRRRQYKMFALTEIFENIKIVIWQKQQSLL